MTITPERIAELRECLKMAGGAVEVFRGWLPLLKACPALLDAAEESARLKVKLEKIRKICQHAMDEHRTFNQVFAADILAILAGETT